MEIVKTKIKITVFGEEYNLSAPKAIEAAEFVDAIEEKKLKSKDMVKLTTDFLEKMGLPKKVSEELELDSLKQIVEYITKKK
jgi:predicted glycosyltransferase